MTANIMTRKVHKGKEKEFEKALSIFIKKTDSFPGVQGVSIIRPALGSNCREYGILRHFVSQDKCDEFYASTLFSEWEKRVLPYCEDAPKPRVVTGLEAWFTLPGQEKIKPPPRWKMALLTLLAIYPLTLLIPAILNLILMEQPKYIENFIVTVSLVFLLTWVIMPNLTRLLKGWIYE